MINTIEGAEESLSMKQGEPKMNKTAGVHSAHLYRLDACLLLKLPFTLRAVLTLASNLTAREGWHTKLAAVTAQERGTAETKNCHKS